MQTFSADSAFDAVNSAFGSRFDFNVSPGSQEVWSGTAGMWRDNAAKYIVGVTPAGSSHTDIFHWGTANATLGDHYVSQEKWTLGLDTTQWKGDAGDQYGMHLTVNLIDPLLGTPACTAIANCSEAVKDNTLPALLVGVNLANSWTTARAGTFLFGSNRAFGSCATHTTPGGMTVTVLTYAPSADHFGGTLFIAGAASVWKCTTTHADRVGLTIAYNIPVGGNTQQYLVVGGWNTASLFANTMLASGCQNEQLYSATEWSSLNTVVDFAIDNLTSGDDLLGHAQTMENLLIDNTILTPAQRWVIAASLHSYKAETWLVARPTCAGGGYDVGVYEGNFGWLSTTDVLHEYGYFEINEVPWYFRQEISTTVSAALADGFGTYFRHAYGVDWNGTACVRPTQGTPAIMRPCPGEQTAPWGTEENTDVALLLAYYEHVTDDASILSTVPIIDAAMAHNEAVGDPKTGIAYNGQDTATTYDDQPTDCLHGNATTAGNVYYLGIKEASAYLASAYLDGLVSGNVNGTRWRADATKIENAVIAEYKANGFVPTGLSGANNCNSRSSVLGEGLFYVDLTGLLPEVNPILLTDLADQYPSDVNTNTDTQYSLLTTESSAATGGSCPQSHCNRFEWFDKAMLSSLVADFVYTQFGCSKGCTRIDTATKVYSYNVDTPQPIDDGQHSDGSDWNGHFYPRDIISWAFLNQGY